MSAPVLVPSPSVIERELARIDAERISGIDADIIRRIHSIDETPEEFLPVLAWEYSVDEWDPVWPIDTKRAVIKVSYEVHRHKGTAYAMETAIEATGLGAKVEEWFEYDSLPYRFRLTVNLQPEQPWTDQNTNQLVRTALRTKNVRSRLETIHLARTTTADGPFVGGLIRMRQTARVAPFVPREIEMRPYVYAGAVVRAKQRISLHPET
jgi:phage tail P2-like protein